MSMRNIEKAFKHVDIIDFREGMNAYENYNKLVKSVADYYKVGFVQSVAAFASLSPNNDYMGTLRSLVTLIQAVKEGKGPEEINMSTYRHCMIRAYDYLTGKKDFLFETEGPKVKNFYCNIIHPEDRRFITIDGHMHNVWAGRVRTMKEALISFNKYNIIAEDFKAVAKKKKLLPNQLQAMLWFTWKRINIIRYQPQVSLFVDPSDYWGLKIKPKDITPFP